jgi:hypothetical protein
MGRSPMFSPPVLETSGADGGGLTGCPREPKLANLGGWMRALMALAVEPCPHHPGAGRPGSAGPPPGRMRAASGRAGGLRWPDGGAGRAPQAPRPRFIKGTHKNKHIGSPR